MQALLIIDMQPEFESANLPFLIRRVIKEIKEAKAKRRWIMIAEYSGYGESHREIQNAIGRYKKVLTIKKTSDDGSSWLIKAMNRHKLSFNKIRVVGVNTRYCVYDTVCGLCENLPNTEFNIVARGCACWNTYSVSCQKKDAKKVFRKIEERVNVLVS